MWPGERPGKARRARSGEGVNVQRPIVSLMSVERGKKPRSLSVVSKVWSLMGGLLNR